MKFNGDHSRSNLVDSDKNTGGVRPDIPSAGGEADVTPGCVAPEVPSSDWVPQFERQEIWVMNTEYRLFGKRGPEVGSGTRVVTENTWVVSKHPFDTSVRTRWTLCWYFCFVTMGFVARGPTNKASV